MRPRPPPFALPRILLFLSLCAFSAAAYTNDRYEAEYTAAIRPESGVIEVELKLAGERLPSSIVLSVDPKRHRNFTSTDPVEIQGSEATWRPRGKFSRLKFEFVVNHERKPGRYDAYMTNSWALFRGDKMMPRARVKARRGLAAAATLSFTAPPGWSVITPYAPVAEHRYAIDDPSRRFDRPEGWMLAGKIGTRGEMIDGVQTIIAAPAGDRARRQDTLAFLNWNLPPLLAVFPDFPRRVLIVQAGDPMWRGGLSGPASMFLHSDRPLISENRTSTLLHELVHLGMRVHGDEESDWIVEGLAEYYSIESLRRSGGISERRHAEAVRRLESWAKRAPTLLVPHANGPVTARAVLTLRQVDAEVRAATSGKASLDDVARRIARAGGEITLARFQKTVEDVAGRPAQALERARLTQPSPAPAQ